MMDDIDSDEQPKRLSDFLGSFHEFLIVLVHCILYVRKVYPEPSFQRVRCYGIATFQSRHPKVCQWIEDMTTSCMSYIRKGSITKLSIVILSQETNTPLERFSLDLRDFPVIDPDEQDLPLEGVAVTWGHLFQEYRSSLVTLTTLADTFGQLPDETTFTIIMETRDGGSQELPWITADRQKFEDRDPSLMARPIRFVDAGPISFNVWLEENKLKQKLAATDDDS
jgi:mitotic spindle assembly checkpoint protein MAD2B